MSAVSPAARVLSSALSLLFFRQREAAVTQVSVEWNGAAPSFFSLKLMAAGVTNVCVFGGGGLGLVKQMMTLPLPDSFQNTCWAD